MTTAYEQTILQKLRHLPPERLAEVEAFVDFLAHHQAKKRGLIQAAGQLATPPSRESGTTLLTPTMTGL
jgi:hypothetical protein